MEYLSVSMNEQSRSALSLAVSRLSPSELNAQSLDIVEREVPAAALLIQAFTLSVSRMLTHHLLWQSKQQIISTALCET